MNPFLLFFALINLGSFCLMGVDKSLARQKARRISERGLFLPALLGGAAGGTLGMFLFRHKTRHWYFRYGFPVLAAVQLALAAVLFI